MSERLGGAEDRGRGRSKLVRRDGDEAVSQLVEPQELIVEKRLLDRHRRALGRELEELHVVRFENAMAKAADVNYAQHATAYEERGAEKRLDSLLAENRVQDVRVIDVLDGERPPLGGDPAGEAAADRDPRAPLDLLLDSLRRARDELVRALVEQEDGARVGSEDLLDPVEQLVEEVLEREVRERRVRDALQLQQPLEACAFVVVHGRGRCPSSDYRRNSAFRSLDRTAAEDPLPSAAVEVDENAPVVARAEIEIAAPPDAVWDVLTDFDRWPTWNPDVSSMTFGGDVVEGAEFRWKAGPTTITSTIRRIERPRLIGWTGRTLGTRAVHVYRLEPRNGATLVTTAESFNGWLARVARGPMRRTLNKSLDAGLEHLKTRVERGA
jgi:uncharacterized protein YndB with AHSA1/START domain